MTRLTQTLRARRASNRSRREMDRAISNAASPAMRDELIVVAQLQGRMNRLG
jgi:hypothetical protein